VPDIYFLRKERGAWTFQTCQRPIADLEPIYGKFISDRMKAMFNEIEFKVPAGGNMAKLTGLKIISDKQQPGIDRIRPIMQFLEDNYEILINCFDPSKSVIRSKKNNTTFRYHWMISPCTFTKKT